MSEPREHRGRRADRRSSLLAALILLGSAGSASADPTAQLDAAPVLAQTTPTATSSGRPAGRVSPASVVSSLPLLLLRLASAPALQRARSSEGELLRNTELSWLRLPGAFTSEHTTAKAHVEGTVR